MSSRSGFGRADIDTGLFNDPKVKRLARLQRDPTRTAISMMLYLSAVLESWRENAPAALVDASPAWFVDDPQEYVADLSTVGLLDDDGKVRGAALDNWMKSVRKSVEGGHEGARRRWGGHRGPIGGLMPSPPASPPDTRARAREDRGPIGRASPKPFGEIMAELGVTKETLGKGKS